MQTARGELLRDRLSGLIVHSFISRLKAVRLRLASVVRTVDLRVVGRTKSRKYTGSTVADRVQVNVAMS